MDSASGNDQGRATDPSSPSTSAAPGTDGSVIVGVGASAGGLEAVKRLLEAVPDGTGMAMVVILHLDPLHESHLAGILANSTAMPVLEAVHGDAVQPGHVYVIPPNVALSIVEGRLQLQPRDALRAPHFTIDHFFRSLAADRGPHAIGVVLSGNNADGALGLRDIKAQGGITFAQTEETAQFSTMPRAAVEGGGVDFVLPPEAIGARVCAVRRHPYLAEGPLPAADDVDALYDRALAAVRAATGVDFTLYRDTTVRRRLARRMALHGAERLDDYVARLEADPEEAEALHEDLLIHVTSFFREPDAFEALKRDVLPRVTRAKAAGLPVRVWVPGCSTGQEAYSLAMALVEHFEAAGVRPSVQIFATDLSDSTLARAREGVYPESIEAEVTPARLRRFFRPDERGYRVDKSLREMCVFARQNVVSDPPFSRLDLVSCRNLLIYLSPELQQRVLTTFHFALGEPGFLLLGTAETVAEGTDLFSVVDRAHRIYVKRPAALRPPLHFVQDELRLPLQRSTGRRGAANGRDNAARAADRVLLERYAPPSVLVNAQLDALQFRGRTGDYLEPPDGEPTAQVLRMAREGLFLELRSALAEAASTGIVAVRTGVRIRRGDHGVDVGLEVHPVAAAGEAGACYLVTFKDESGTPAAPLAEQELPTDDTMRELVRLRQELSASREYLRALVDQQDTANEELRSANEEILSSNEELQSTNEELETAKEELQSTNEELTTVNEQVERRNAELSLANSDLLNLLSSTNIPVVMVDGELRVRRYTPPAALVLSLLPGDVGRPITDIRPALLLPDLDAVLLRVIDTGQPFEAEVRDREGRWFLLRIHPYHTGDERTEGAVVSLVDIDQRKRADAIVQEGRQKDVFLAMLAHELRNPLAPVRHAVEILRMGRNDPAAIAGACGILERQVDHLARIIEDLVDVSRITERKIRLRREAVPLRELLETAVQACRAAIDRQGQQLDLRIPEEPLALDVDPVRAGQIFGNLLSNASKFTRAGGHIEVSACRVDGEGRADAHGAFAAVSVRDDGVGIAPELLPHVFEMFTQGEQSLERSRGGLGIGLAVVQSLAQLHGGTIDVESDGVGKGATFTVRLPLARAGAGGGRPAVRPNGADGAGTRRVLVVDDNADQAESLAMVLRLLGHEVRTAADGTQGLQAAKAFGPEVAIIDLGLPGMNGYELATHLRGLPGLAPLTLVAHSGWGSDEDRSRSRKAGFDHHFVKPAAIDDLRSVLAHSAVHPAV